MLRLEMLPADQGDCLWLEYGDPGLSAGTHRVLIDSGTPATYARLAARIAELPPDDRRFELLIVSHIDSDHIGGAVKLLEEPPEGLEIGDVWFNGFRHLPKPPEDELGERQGEELTTALTGGRFAWNRAFEGKAVVVPEAGPLPTARLAGGLELTLLSPGPRQLAALYPKWAEALAEMRQKEAERAAREEPPDLLGEGLDVAALAAAPFKEDRTVNNGSSIAVLARHGRHALLLGADAFPSVVAAAVDRLLLASGQTRLRLDACKLCHHGSRKNTSRALLDQLDCRHYLVSTNGNRTDHPDPEGIARVLVHGGREKTIHFNYRTEFTDIWEDPTLKRRHGYETRYPEAGAGPGLAFELGD